MASRAFDVAGNAVGVPVEMDSQVFLHFAGGHESVDLGGTESEQHVWAADMDGWRYATISHPNGDATFGKAARREDGAAVGVGAMLH